MTLTRRNLAVIGGLNLNTAWQYLSDLNRLRQRRSADDARVDVAR